MSDKMLASVFSPAKLNLFLHITGKRTDGYHNLQTVFVALDFGDDLRFFVSDSDELITLVGADGLTDTLNDNLIIKAGKALAEFATAQGLGDKLFHIKIDLTKRIPTGAGLGGGSSNAGAVLTTLNRLWGLDFDTPTLIQLAKKLGADVPFFVLADTHPTCIGEGIGERLTPIALPKSHYLLLFPKVHNSTAGLFGNPNLIKNYPTLSHSEIIDKQADFVHSLNRPFYNAFESIVRQNPSIDKALTYLQSLPTTATARLTGTGSTVFLPIDDVALASDWLDNAPCGGVICQTL